MSDEHNIQIFVRCRPLTSNERVANLILDPDNQTIRIESQNKEFYFDQVFTDATPQESVFNAVVMPLIPQVLQGYNCAVMAYGQTGTGKTYTMEGAGVEEMGIIPRAVGQIFNALRQRGQNFSINVSFLELYSEEAYDLLSPLEDTTKLRIFDDKTKQRSVKIEGLKEVPLESENDIFEVLARGSGKRQTADTMLNACSSRSHSIFSITVNIKTDAREIIRTGKLSLVDLAGSENIARSGALSKHAREAGNINQSLLTLTRVITALVEKRSHVPFRESKLTRILQDSLGGATRTSMIATVSLSQDDFNNTVSTLDYASRARGIINRPESNRQINHRKTSDFEEYRIQFESELEDKIRNEVAMDFRRETQKIRDEFQGEIENLIKQNKALNSLIRDKEIEEALHKSEIEELTKQTQLFSSQIREKDRMIDEHKRQLDELTRQTHVFSSQMGGKDQEIEDINRQLTELTEQNKVLTSEAEQEIEELTKQNKLLNFMIKDKDNLIEALRRDFKKREEELHSKLQATTLQPIKEEVPPTPEPKRAAKLSKRAPVQEDDYANMTFTGDDEIVQVSAKKTRSRITAAPKQRQDLTLSGKKRKLTNFSNDIDVSPISPPVRVTRSRNTRRKLAY